MDYDERDLRPLFTFRVGDPGHQPRLRHRRRAWGCRPTCWTAPGPWPGEERVQVEKLLADLDRRARELADGRAGTRRGRPSGRARTGELDERLAGLDKETQGDAVAAARRRGRGPGARGPPGHRERPSARSAPAARDRRWSGGPRPAGRAGARRSWPDERRPSRRLAVATAVGERVRIPHLGLIGRGASRSAATEDHGHCRRAAPDPGPRGGARRPDAAAPDADGPRRRPPPVDAGNWAWQGEAPRGRARDRPARRDGRGGLGAAGPADRSGHPRRPGGRST